jgi:hypothetical protein
MSVDAGPVIEAAVDLAWRPTCNTSHRAAYRGRMESHERLLEVLRSTPDLPADETPLGYLIRAIRRVARASFSNRQGEPYNERKEAVRQLRGCLEVWMREESGR